jgi:hypothetical protein
MHTHLHLAPMLKMIRSIPPFPIYAFMACTKKKFYFGQERIPALSHLTCGSRTVVTFSNGPAAQNKVQQNCFLTDTRV